MAPEFKAALPEHVSVEKFTRVAMTAIQNTPALVNADRRSLFGAFVRLAQDGLLPDGREAAVVMFGNKAQAMPMIAGILKKVRQSGDVAKISAYVVHENDQFTVRYGFDEDVEHIPPPLNKPRGEAIGAYATAVLKDGSKLLEVMSLEEIEKVRKVSRAAAQRPLGQLVGRDGAQDGHAPPVEAPAHVDRPRGRGFQPRRDDGAPAGPDARRQR
jgi:recombination protein RecT